MKKTIAGLGIVALIVGGAIGYNMGENNVINKDKLAVVQNKANKQTNEETKPVPAELQEILDQITFHKTWYNEGATQEEIDQAIELRKKNLTQMYWRYHWDYSNCPKPPVGDYTTEAKRVYLTDEQVDKWKKGELDFYVGEGLFKDDQGRTYVYSSKHPSEELIKWYEDNKDKGAKIPGWNFSSYNGFVDPSKANKEVMSDNLLLQVLELNRQYLKEYEEWFFGSHVLG